mmetsp:Transcript_19131/g.61553  ORF Transcript_19131/g.61553 Transcript_19131/m.61553 type:complete len:103 (-) Transcript_19131:1312-1620(-)
MERKTIFCSGKTDVATQICTTILRNDEASKILVVAHSNAALNDLFEKLVDRGVEPRTLVRLGAGARELSLEESYSPVGRVDANLERRAQLLEEVHTGGWCRG